MGVFDAVATHVGGFLHSKVIDVLLGDFAGTLKFTTIKVVGVPEAAEVEGGLLLCGTAEQLHELRKCHQSLP